MDNIEKKGQKREDIDAKTSSKTGFSWLVETLLRRFRILFHISVLSLLYVLVAALMGIALIPGVYLFHFLHTYTQSWIQIFHFAALGFAVAGAYFLYAFTLTLFVLPTANFVFRTKLEPSRGIYYSTQTIKWYIHNGFTYVARYTCLQFFTPSPFSMAFYRLMGMKIGKGVQLNSVNISDPSLLELEDKVTIGGSATLICHYGVGGFLIIAPVKIRKGATIGMKATVMGDVVVGEKAKVLANSLVLPKTRIPAGEVWAGIPAVCIRKAKDEDKGGEQKEEAKKEENQTEEKAEQ